MLEPLTRAFYGQTKSHSSPILVHSAQFYDGYGWYGALDELRPGYGYLLQVSVAGTATFR